MTSAAVVIYLTVFLVHLHGLIALCDGLADVVVEADGADAAGRRRLWFCRSIWCHWVGGWFLWTGWSNSS